MHPDTGSEYVLGGTQDNGTWNISGTGIQSGAQRVGGDGGYTHIDQVDPSYQFTATVYNSIYRSTNGGGSWSYYANHEDASGGDTGFFINPSVIDGANKAFYSAVDGSTILRLNNYVNLSDKTFNECYFRIYCICIQDVSSYRWSLICWNSWRSCI